MILWWCRPLVDFFYFAHKFSCICVLVTWQFDHPATGQQVIISIVERFTAVDGCRSSLCETKRSGRVIIDDSRSYIASRGKVAAGANGGSGVAVKTTDSPASAAEFFTSSLLMRLLKFAYDPEHASTSGALFKRCEDATSKDCSTLDNAGTARFVVLKLGAAAYADCTGHIVPKSVSEALSKAPLSR